MKTVILLTACLAMAHYAMCQTLVAKVEKTTSPDGKYDIEVSGKPDWHESDVGAKALYIVNTKTKKAVAQLEGFKGYNGWRYPDLEAQWSPDSSKVAIYRGYRKVGSATVYVLRGKTFVPRKIPRPDVDALLEKEPQLQHPGRNYHMLYDEYQEITGWNGNNELEVNINGELLRTDNNGVNLEYKVSYKIKIGDDGKIKVGKPDTTVGPSAIQ